jgi:hypothetical protein
MVAYGEGEGGFREARYDFVLDSSDGSHGQ